jgi:helix-turn-helix protein
VIVVDDDIAGLWTHRETAAFLRITPGTLYVWLHKGIGPKSYKVRGSRRYDPRDIQAFVRQHDADTTPGTGHVAV